MLPGRIGGFHAQGAARTVAEGQPNKPAEVFNATSYAVRDYVSANGEAFTVALIKTRSDSSAYALLTTVDPRTHMPLGESESSSVLHIERLEGIGTSAFSAPGRVAFFKGTTFVEVSRKGDLLGSNENLISFARLLADTLDKGEEDIPVLVKHLPQWESASERATYAVTAQGLREAVGGGQSWSVLDAVSFEGGTEAVTTTYGPSRMVLVEYTTPQIASASDAKILAKIKELRDAGQPVPTAYKRVGNYSVFVFDAPDEQTAEQLINGVSYEQVVQWLGENPRLLERAQRYYTQVTSGVLIAVLKASGLSVLVCFGLGGLAGWLVFKRRRARAAVTEAYSDAGGIVRLNLDEMTPQTDSSRLLGKGDV